MSFQYYHNLTRVGKSAHGLRPAVLLFAFVILIVSVACGLPFGGDPTPRVPDVIPSPTLPPLPTATPKPLPPSLVESDPPIRAEMPVNGPITLFFNQPMDRDSVEATLTSQMEQQLTFSWIDDTTVIVYLSQDLAPETALAFELGEDVRSRQGLSLTQPISLNFRAAGYLHLVQFLPEDQSSEVDPSSAVVASFNRPVVPLGADPASLPAGFTLEPAAAGNGVWLNTSTFVFYPAPALAGGVTYTAALNPDLRSTDGTPLQQTFKWSFTTAAPEILSLEPSSEIAWPLDPKISVTFNQPMDRASVEARFSFTLPDGRPVAGKFAWEEDDTRLIFTPDALLPRNTTFNLSLDEQTLALGGSQLTTPLSMMVMTVPELRVSNTVPAQGGVKPVNSSLELYFTSPLSPKQDILPYITLEPAVRDLQFSIDNYTVYLFGSFAPSTDYLLKISPTLTDIWGGSLGEEFQLSFRTDPLPPSLSILTGADAIFLTPQDISLIVQAANISEVPLTIGGVPLNDLFALLGPNGYELRQNYQSLNQVSFTQPIDLPPDQNQAVQVFLSPDQQALTPGIYDVHLDFPQDGSFGNIYPGPYLVVVSNVQLTFKLSASDSLVWAVDLRTGAALADAPINLYDEDGSLIAAGQTDAQGLFRSTFETRADPYRTVYAVLGQPGQETFGMAFSNWTSGIDPWDFEINFEAQMPGTSIYFYTDRPIYRPGQTVYFRAIARKVNNGRYSPPDIPNLPIVIFGSEGRELTKMELPLTAFGSAHGQFDLPRDAQPGYYSMGVQEGFDGSVAPTTYLGFQVANYRKPEINLSVEFSPEQTQAGEQLNASILARYFFDAPAGNLPVRWALYAKSDYFNLPGYQVGPEDTSWLNAFRLPNMEPPLGTLVSQGEAMTNPDGSLALDFPSGPDDLRQVYTLEATITDESGLSVSSRGSILVNPDTFYIGVRPDVWVGEAGKQIEFEVQSVDWEKAPAANIPLRAEFQQVIFERSDPAPDDPLKMPSFTPRYSPVGSVDFVTSPEDGLARVAFTPAEPGTYMLDVYNQALPPGEGSRTQILIWVGGAGQVTWPNLPNSRLRLTSDQDSYKPGDTAQIFIPNPYGSQISALLTVERSVIMDYQIVQIGPGGQTFNLPLTDEEAPNVVVSVTLLGRNERGNPDFRQGFINLSVEPLEQQLNVTLLTQPERTGPGEEVQFDVLVTDRSGNPVQGEFSLAVIDLAVLALADPNSKDILPAFYGLQPLGVRTSLSLAVYNRRLLDLPLGLGGGGGDTAPSVVRERFPDTAYWNAEIVTDVDGKASVTITLPDTLTTWQADTRGLTLDTRVGQAQAQIVTTKDLLIRPVTSRFFVANDYAQVASVVQNNTAVSLQAQVSLQANGFELENPAQKTQTIDLPAGGRARVEWWGVVQDVDEVDLIFSVDGSDASGNRYEDAARPAQGILPVLRYITPQVFRTAGMLEGADQITELVSLPRSFEPSSGELSLELSPSLAAAMIRAMDALESAPFESTEQILSNFLPNLETYRTLQEYGIQDDGLKARLDRTLNEGLVRLLARQNYDGGWSWWQDGVISETSTSDPYITAYVLFGLKRARLAGVSINQYAIDQGLTYMKENTPQLPQGSAPPHSGRAGLSSVFPTGDATVLKGGGWPESTWEWDRQAFQQYVLAQWDAADPLMVEQVYQARQNLSPWAKALLVLTEEALKPGSEEGRALLTTLQEQVNRSATGAFWEFSQDPDGLLASNLNMHTNISNSAIVLFVLAQRDPGSPLVADTVRYLMANRGADGAWASTYATAWTLIGLDQVLKGTGELGGDFAFGASLNNNPIADGVAGGVDQLTAVTADVPVQRMYADYPNALVIEREGGQGRLYYAAGLNVSRPVEEATPLSQGLTIERKYNPFSPECRNSRDSNSACDPIQSAQAGEKVTVRLTLTAPKDMAFLAVTDYIPAGAEILDTSLKTTEIGYNPEMGMDGEPAVEPLFDPRRPFAEGWGWWLFSQPQIYDDHIAWTANNLPAGTYELTYTLLLLQPGQFRVLPARAWQLYFPEVQANSAGSVFEIKP